MDRSARTLGLCAWLGACAATTSIDARDLTLLQAQESMLAHNPAFKANRYRLEGAEADKSIANEAPNPQFSLNSSSISFRDGVGSGAPWDKRADSIARIDQLFERGGKRESRTAMATAEATAVAADVDDAARTGKLQVAQAYFELKRADEIVRTATELLNLETQSLDAAQQRLRAGDIATADVARLSVELARVRSDLSTAQTARDTAQIVLAALLGDDRLENINPVDAWPAPDTPSRTTPDAALIDDRADVRAAQARASKADNGVRLAHALRAHDISFGVQYERDLTVANSSALWGVGISVPLFLRHRYQGELQRALADKRVADQALKQTQLTAIAERDQALNELQGARTRLSIFQEGVIAQAKIASDAVEYAYSRGSAGLSDLLDARRSLQAVMTDMVNAQADYAKALAQWQAIIETRSGPLPPLEEATSRSEPLRK